MLYKITIEPRNHLSGNNITILVEKPPRSNEPTVKFSLRLKTTCSQVYSWFNRLKDGQESIENYTKLTQSITDNNIEKVHRI